MCEGWGHDCSRLAVGDADKIPVASTEVGWELRACNGEVEVLEEKGHTHGDAASVPSSGLENPPGSI